VKPNYKANKGFTLVEMLVSMVLLSMVLLIASKAYALFSDRWNGRLGHFNKSMTQAKQFILVQETLKSIVSYVVVDDDKQAKIYFEGNRNGFVAVTLRSLYTPEVAAVMRLQVSQNADFTYTLSYQEFAMTQQLLTNMTQPINFSEPIVLFDNLTNIDFQYFGWPSTKSKYWQADTSSGRQEPQAWFDEYNSLEINLQPEQIKINFTSSQGEYSLQVKLVSSISSTYNKYSNEE